MSLFKNESPLLSRNAAIAATVAGSGTGPEPAQYNLVPTEYVITVPPFGAAGAGGPVASGGANVVVFISDDNYQVDKIKYAASAQGVATASFTIEKLTGTTAPGSGTAMFTAANVNTVVINTVTNPTLTTTTATLQLAPGDRIGAVYGGNCNALVMASTIYLKRIS